MWFRFPRIEVPTFTAEPSPARPLRLGSPYWLVCLLVFLHILRIAKIKDILGLKDGHKEGLVLLPRSGLGTASEDLGIPAARRATFLYKR